VRKKKHLSFAKSLEFVVAEEKWEMGFITKFYCQGGSPYSPTGYIEICYIVAIGRSYRMRPLTTTTTSLVIWRKERVIRPRQT
jgi:hypothetical protein